METTYRDSITAPLLTSDFSTRDGAFCSKNIELIHIMEQALPQNVTSFSFPDYNSWRSLFDLISSLKRFVF